MSGPTLTHWSASPRGHMRESPRSEVSPAVLEALAPLVGGAVAGTDFAIPGRPGWRCAVVESAGGGALFGHVAREGAPPALYLAVGRDAGPEAGEAWGWCCRRGVGCSLDSRRPPAAPWVVSAIALEGLGEVAALAWLGDAVRCLAWAWLSWRGRFQIREGGDPPPPWRTVEWPEVRAALEARNGPDAPGVLRALVRAGPGAVTEVDGGRVLRRWTE